MDFHNIIFNLILQVVDNEDGHRLIYYTPCSGIWQSVWMEAVESSCFVAGTRVTTDIDAGILDMMVDVEMMDFCGLQSYRLSVLDGSSVITEATGQIDDDVWKISTPLPMENMMLWSPENPKLYNYSLEIYNDAQERVDMVSGYFGMRKIEIRTVGKFERFFLNNELLPFQLGPLDQGYWPDGIYSAPSEEAMLWDLEQTRDLGFNMVRKHVKVEPGRWYYATDRLGLLVWQDFPAISTKYNGQIEDMAEAQEQFGQEWREWMHERFNHPSIIVWVVYNEGWGQHQTAEVTAEVMTADPSRLVDSASGWTDYGVGHLRDYHVYPGPCIVDGGCLPSSPGRREVEQKYITCHRTCHGGWRAVGPEKVDPRAQLVRGPVPHSWTD